MSDPSCHLIQQILTWELKKRLFDWSTVLQDQELALSDILHFHVSHTSSFSDVQKVFVKFLLVLLLAATETMPHAWCRIMGCDFI